MATQTDTSRKYRSPNAGYILTTFFLLLAVGTYVALHQYSGKLPHYPPGPRASTKNLTSFNEFYKFYRTQHTDNISILLHTAGTLMIWLYLIYNPRSIISLVIALTVGPFSVPCPISAFVSLLAEIHVIFSVSFLGLDCLSNFVLPNAGQPILSEYPRFSFLRHELSFSIFPLHSSNLIVYSGLLASEVFQAAPHGFFEFGIMMAVFSFCNLILTGHSGLVFVVVAYSLAWVGHFYFEKNTPATFIYPSYSLLGDFMQTKEVLQGTIVVTVPPQVMQVIKMIPWKIPGITA